MKIFNHILANTLVVAVGNMFVWFAIIFWMYLETASVLSTAYSGGIFMVAMSLSSFWFGSIVDHHKKKNVIVVSSITTLLLFAAALAVYVLTPTETFKNVKSPALWFFIAFCLAAVIASNLRAIAVPTLVTLLVPEKNRAKANGMVGMVMGLSSMGAGFGSGFALARLGLFWVLVIGIAIVVIALIHLCFISVPEPVIAHIEGKPKQIDIRGTVRAIGEVSGLFALILFTTFNNFLGGVFMALMDAYGLSLVRVETWSVLWGVLSSGFILGGLYIAKYGLGKNPLRTLFTVNIITWIVCILFAAQPSIVLLSVGILIWVCLFPFIEATEHTIIQKAVPYERQGRVIGFAQSVESAASPVTAFLIGPIAQFIFIPFMTSGSGVALIGDWFGVGPGRGIALVFIMTGVIGLMVTLFAMRSSPYKLLAERYRD